MLAHDCDPGSWEVEAGGFWDSLGYTGTLTQQLYKRGTTAKWSGFIRAVCDGWSNEHLPLYHPLIETTFSSIINQQITMVLVILALPLMGIIDVLNYTGV